MPNRAKHITLICLPFAGGTSGAFRKFEEHLAPEIKPFAVELPGHGSLFGQPLLNTLEEMTDFVFKQVKHLAKADSYAIFGHSMGGMLAYLLARRIRDKLLPPPLHLFVSARRSAHVTPEFQWKDLSREEFLDRLAALGGIPKEVLANRELMDIFEPIIYNDIKALETHTHDEIAPLLVPISVFLGEEDDIPMQDALLWCKDTIGQVDVKVFPGGHFFAFERPEEMGDAIRETIAKRLQYIKSFRSAAAKVMGR